MTVDRIAGSISSVVVIGISAFAAVVNLASAQPDETALVGNLLTAYPDHFSAINGNFLIWRDGTRMRISDGKAQKDFDTLLNQPDVDDMFVQPYPPGRPTEPPALNTDPGRIRFELLFAKMYGDCSHGEVAGRMRRVAWLPSRHGGSVMMTTVNGAADHLEAVVRDLEKLPAEMTRFLVPNGGTYNCRRIAGTERRSMHAYGAAIDINTKFTDYWLWASSSSGTVPYNNRIPFEIVEVFERHGFIWGGKWYHYDTMHFEYRPELIKPRD
jgi:D-alanyl-D-alanine carboxypeptidase